MYPSTAYGNSMRILLALVAFWSLGPVVMYVFVPMYAKLNCATAYEYLEKRFHVSVRCLASALFIILRIAWMAAATFAASVAIAGILGGQPIELLGFQIPIQYVVTVGLGVVAIAYTMLGGLRAVMWTDVLQFFVFFGTILFAAILLIGQSEGGASRIYSTYFEGRGNMLFDFSLDPTVRFGTIAILIGSFLEGLSSFGADQVAVQRYIAAKDVKTSQVGFLINLIGMGVVLPGLLAIGMGLFSYFHHHPEDLAPVLIDKIVAGEAKSESLARLSEAAGNAWPDPDRRQLEEFYAANPGYVRTDVLANNLQDQALPRFVTLKFPPGVVGLLVAALMSATMSSIDSGIHSITTAVIVDFRDRLWPNLRPKTDAGEMLVARCLVLLVGAMAVTLACFVGELGDVFAVAKKTVGAFAAPLLAVFALGFFAPWARTIGVFIGTWSGAAITLVTMAYYPDWFSMWFFPFGFFVSVGLSLILSVPFLSTKEDGTRYTYWNVIRSKDDAQSGT
ncbi:MAG: hypothetical protein CMJ78_20250 [Planctomycetaceae bacterium]|nr:hypothetical protein [Planctomycetaceae bacterium]